LTAAQAVAPATYSAPATSHGTPAGLRRPRPGALSNGLDGVHDQLGHFSRVGDQ
jgi:hypothetical protein